jgi:hypothetical protein
MFAIDDFKTPISTTAVVEDKPHVPKHKSGEWFLKGPIPGAWLSVAAAHPGKTLHVTLAIWYMAGLTRQPTVKLCRKPLNLLGVGRDAAREGLSRLEQRGLVSVVRKTGACPVVTLRHTPGPAGSPR